MMISILKSWMLLFHLSSLVAIVTGQQFQGIIEDLDYNEAQITTEFNPRPDRNSGSITGGVKSVDPPIFDREKHPPAEDHGESESDNNPITAHVTNSMDAGGTVEIDCGAYEVDKLTVIFKRIDLAPLQGATFHLDPLENEIVPDSSSLECAFVWGNNVIPYILYKTTPHNSEEPFSSWLLNEKGLFFKAPGLGFLLVRMWDKQQ